MILAHAAKFVRSKNAGPFLLTFDIIFPDRETFDRIAAAGRLTGDAVARAYRISANEVIGFAYYPFANAVKFSLRRPVPSGAVGDSDVYGAQQHAPLLNLEVT